MADTSTNKKIKVSGHLEERRGIYRVMLTWTDALGNRGRKSVSTGLPVKGNKTRAEDMLIDVKREQEAVLRGTAGIDRLLFADFMEQWLEVVRHEVKPNTFGGY